MPKNSISVEVYTSDSDEPHVFADIHYISLVNNETYGIPAIISEQDKKDEGLPLRILYVNPHNIVAMQAVRES